MILKRGAVLMLSVFMLTALAGCKPPAKQEAKETLPKVIEKDEPEWRSYISNEVKEFYPEIKEIETYLFEQYPDVFVKEEQLSEEEKKNNLPISFIYSGGGGSIPEISVYINVKEDITKKQMIEITDYMMKELMKLFPKETETRKEVLSRVVYNNEGKEDENLISTKEKIKAVLEEGSEEVVWVHLMSWGHLNDKTDWFKFNPEEVTEDELLADVGIPIPRPEPKPREIAVIRGLTLEGIKEYLGKAEVKETDVTEEEGGYTSTGMDSTGTYGYKAFYDNNKEGITKVSYIINKTGNLTEEEFVSLAEYYLAGCAMMEYERAEPERASDFIQEKIEEVAETKKSAEEVCGGVQLTLSREGDTFILTAVNME